MAASHPHSNRHNDRVQTLVGGLKSGSSTAIGQGTYQPCRTMVVLAKDPNPMAFGGVWDKRTWHSVLFGEIWMLSGFSSAKQNCAYHRKYATVNTARSEKGTHSASGWIRCLTYHNHFLYNPSETNPKFLSQQGTRAPLLTNSVNGQNKMEPELYSESHEKRPRKTDAYHMRERE